ncbi:MAG: Rpn family recombination-promoting nuclease/putative transposase [Solobacterium sp.]|nr:Rpn family recombination-promoting nuclease/putative transposase [Solobacterium sp.]
MSKQQKKQRKQKDLAEKKLLDCNDVFADIVNAVVFQGKPVIRPEDLREVHPVSAYSEGDFRQLERDIVKRWVKGKTTLCFLGAENQNEIDPDMLFRNIGYDGVTYREELNRGKERYPVITFVLYYGDKPWNKPLSLYETLGNIPQELKRYVNDYRMILIDIKRLDKKTIQRLQSDFRVITEHIQNRNRNDYEPDDTRKIVHAEEVGAFMTEYSGINYSSAVQSLRKRRKKITMKSLLSEAEKKEILEKNTEDVTQKVTADVTQKVTADVTRKVTAEVTVKNSAACVLNLMKKKNMTIEDIFETLEIPSEIQEAVLEEVKKLS